MSTDLQNLLVRQSIVSIEQIRRAEAAARGTESTWLEQLLMSRQVDEATVARVAGAARRVPSVDLQVLAHLPGNVIAALPRDLAIEHRVVPVALEADGDLTVAMVDPCNEVAAQELEFFLGCRVLREVAPATPLAWALAAYYAASSPLSTSWDPETSLARPRRMARGSVSGVMPALVR